MRVLVVSDSHRRRHMLAKAIKSQPSAEMILFLGDGVEEAEELSRELLPHQTMVMVRGNNDWCCSEPLERQLQIGDHKILMMHGHSRMVKYGIGGALEAARACGADILLFGHTHLPVCEYVDGIYVVNPGALSMPMNGFPTYAFIDIVPQGILPSIVKLNP
ncbi:MAG: YfcE family phosphodiesterase [Clostridia bacterium]|nr:YfcE family phosphodiesterase [Clostridia bacterium]